MVAALDASKAAEFIRTRAEHICNALGDLLGDALERMDVEDDES
jgi:hypothetical protein